jgi:hypothetical protein
VPASTYHYRLVAANATGTSYGADQTFSTLAPAPPPGGGKPPVPEVRVVSSTLWASTRGVLTVKLRCPASAGTCKGTIAIRSPYRRRTRTLLYAHGSFTIAGGHVLSLRLHLSRRARSLLAHHHHRLGAVVVISVRDPAGGTFGRHLAVTIRLLSPRRR